MSHNETQITLKKSIVKIDCKDICAMDILDELNKVGTYFVNTSRGEILIMIRFEHDNTVLIDDIFAGKNLTCYTVSYRDELHICDRTSDDPYDLLYIIKSSPDGFELFENKDRSKGYHMIPDFPLQMVV